MGEDLSTYRWSLSAHGDLNRINLQVGLSGSSSSSNGAHAFAATQHTIGYIDAILESTSVNSDNDDDAGDVNDDSASQSKCQGKEAQCQGGTSAESVLEIGST